MALAWGCDKFLFKTYKINNMDDYDGAVDLLPDDTDLRRYIRVNGRLEMNRSRNSCRRLAYSATVAWNGELLPCCFSVNDFHSFGNVFQQPFRDVWRGRTIREFQRVVNNGGRDRIPMCRNCTEGLKRLYLPPKLVCR